MPRCLSCKSEKRQDLQCECRAKKGSDFCGKHIKGKFVYNNMATKIKNRGTGAGGAKTNKNGLPYEELTELKEDDRYKNKETIKIEKKNLNKVQIDNQEFMKLSKGELKGYMKHHKKFNIKSEKTLQPDECYVDEVNKIINIIEKKFQQCAGSVDEKIQTGPFKIWFYKEQYPDYEIRYCYCLSDWFRSDKYKPEMRFLKEYNIEVFWGSDKSYVTNILDWIVNEDDSKKVEDVEKTVVNEINAEEE
jgi:hypothetical protein